MKERGDDRDLNCWYCTGVNGKAVTVATDCCMCSYETQFDTDSETLWSGFGFEKLRDGDDASNIQEGSPVAMESSEFDIDGSMLAITTCDIEVTPASSNRRGC